MEARRSKVQPGEVVGYVDQDALGTLKLSRTQYAQLWGDPFFRSVPLYLHPPASREREALAEIAAMVVSDDAEDPKYVQASQWHKMKAIAKAVLSEGSGG